VVLVVLDVVEEALDPDAAAEVCSGSFSVTVDVNRLGLLVASEAAVGGGVTTGAAAWVGGVLGAEDNVEDVEEVDDEDALEEADELAELADELLAEDAAELAEELEEVAAVELTELLEVSVGVVLGETTGCGVVETVGVEATVSDVELPFGSVGGSLPMLAIGLSAP